MDSYVGLIMYKQEHRLWGYMNELCSAPYLIISLSYSFLICKVGRAICVLRLLVKILSPLNKTLKWCLRKVDWWLPRAGGVGGIWAVTANG
ncbi:protein FAM223B-like [Lemur catta]|uniref:protein FAM223B-like n=1 Tax=Lemur catta TaxID=9447 RepID=UPI001E26BD3B|nr:protein FAM223B-like [Lemur catta]